MNIVINHAILHILDFNSGVTVYSDEELAPEDSIQTFLTKHIEKAWGNQSAKPGTFYDDSMFKQHLAKYQAGELDFVAFSKEIGKTLEQAFTHAEEMASADIIVADVRIDDAPQLVIFKSNCHMGYTHQVTRTENGEIRNEIINHYSIMPSLTQAIDEFALVDLQTSGVTVRAKKYTIDGNSIYVLPEILLECSLAPSPQEAVMGLEKTVRKVAEAYGQDEVAATNAAKQYVATQLEQEDELDLQQAGAAIFKDSPAMQADFKDAVTDAGFTAPVQVDREATLKKVCKHKLRTDTGIELTIPTDYFDNTEFVEFNNNEDGTLSITLKHISNIVNR